MTTKRFEDHEEKLVKVEYHLQQWGGLLGNPQLFAVQEARKHLRALDVFMETVIDLRTDFMLSHKSMYEDALEVVLDKLIKTCAQVGPEEEV